ncbi:MAG: class B sortase [Oscillospiraceae bacterium]|nr:class B sortase [Oscillospiraceae bacterium]
MKEKLQRFIKAFQMHGPVRRHTLTACGIVSLLLVVVLAAALGGCGKKTQEAETPVDETPIETPDVEVEPVEVVLPEGAQEIMDKYADVYAWLEIPGTAAVLGTPADVSYPIAQHPTDRDYYLNRDLDGNTSKAGTLFTEAWVEGIHVNGTIFSDPVTIIYGHNMANRTMFGGLQTYLKQLRFDDDQVVNVYQKGRKLTYRIVGGAQYSLDHILYYHDFTNPAVFNDFFAQLWQEKDASTNVDKDNIPVAGDRVLILSVCKNGDDNHRYLVVCKLVEDTDEINAANLAAAQEAALKAAQDAANQG